MENKNQLLIVFKAVAVLLLLWAFTDHPYSYYQILRWVVCGFTAYCAYLAYEKKDNTWTWIFSIIAVLFNPIVPFYFERETWQIIDVITAVIIFVSIFKKNFFKHGAK